MSCNAAIKNHAFSLAAKTTPVRIRHVASGRYLYVNSTPAQDAEAQHKGLLYETLLVNDNEVVDIKRR